MKAKIKDFVVTIDRRQLLTLELSEDFRSQYDKLKDKLLSFKLKIFRKSRSLDANSYFWVLCQKLGKVLKEDSTHIYRTYIKQTNVYRDFHLLPEEAESFKTAWNKLGLGWACEQVDGDKERLIVRAWFGSSEYNTKQMSRLIEIAVEDCKIQGIETMTPDEIAKMLSLWGEK